MTSTWYEITDAEEQDLETILELASSVSVFTFNALRSTGQERVAHLRNEFHNLKRYARQGAYRFLVARDRESGKTIGYLLLNLYSHDDLGRRQTFVEDIGASPEYWGRGIGHALFDAATALTAELGIDFMGGEVAATNPRWEAALRNDFFLESYRVVRPCTPRGRALIDRVREARQAQDQLQAKLQARKEARRSRRKLDS